MKLFLAARWGNDSSEDGANGEDTVFLVRASDRDEAVAIVEWFLEYSLTHRRVEPRLHKITELGEDVSNHTEASIIWGPVFQFATYDMSGYPSWMREAHSDDPWVLAENFWEEEKKAQLAAGTEKHPIVGPYFTAIGCFDPSDGESWESYVRLAAINGLTEVVSLDGLLCPNLVTELREEDWRHRDPEVYHLNFFDDVGSLMPKVQGIARKNIIGIYRNPEAHIAQPPAPGFYFVGYDLIEDATQISALTNCQGFPDVFNNAELNRFGLLPHFDRALEVKHLLAERHPEEAHAQCELYALWRLAPEE